MDISAKIIEKSADFLKASLKDDVLIVYMDFFKKIDASALTNLLENEKKVFWLNLYNGLIQSEVSKMTGQKVDKSIFSKNVVNVAGQALSFDQIEHGIVRGNFWKYGLGYLPGKYLNKVTSPWKCKRLDPRIHFQLNCGAASCPMVRILTSENLEQELMWGEADYMHGESTLNGEGNKIVLSGLFLFYLKDFGGRQGVKALVQKYFPEKKMAITYKKFDWTTLPKKIKT